MILADVNVLVHAFRTDSVEHDRCRSWLMATVSAPSAYGVSPQVLASVIRITTNPRVFVRPSSLADVFEFCRVVLDQPTATVIEPGKRHWSIFEDLCTHAKAKGNLVQDVWFAALAIEAGCEWVTLDRDYAKFKGLRWRAP